MKALLGASALALAFGFNAFADGADDFGTANLNIAASGGNAASESFNSSRDAVSVQTLTASTIGLSLDLSGLGSCR